MCGIAGALVYGNAPADLFFDAVRACRSRGQDSFGLVRWSLAEGWKEVRSFASDGAGCSTFLADQGCPRFYLHTSRAEPTTEYKRLKSEDDVPPFRRASVAVAHNGTIANDRQLARRFGIQVSSSIDTAIMPELVRRLGFWQALKYLQGGCAFGVVDAECGSLYMARNFLPLTIVWQPGILVFASERNFFPQADSPFPPYRMWDLPAYMGIEFSPLGYRDPVPWGELPQQNWNPFPHF